MHFAQCPDLDSVVVLSRFIFIMSVFRMVIAFGQMSVLSVLGNFRTEFLIAQT